MSWLPQAPGLPWVTLATCQLLGQFVTVPETTGFPLTSLTHLMCSLEPAAAPWNLLIIVRPKTKDLHPLGQGVDEDLWAHGGTSFSWPWDHAGPHTSVWAILGVRVSSSPSSRQGLKNIPEPCGSVSMSCLSVHLFKQHSYSGPQEAHGSAPGQHQTFPFWWEFLRDNVV